MKQLLIDDVDRTDVDEYSVANPSHMDVELLHGDSSVEIANKLEGRINIYLKVRKTRAMKHIHFETKAGTVAKNAT